MYPIISGIKHKKGSANPFNRKKYKFQNLKKIKTQETFKRQIIFGYYIRPQNSFLFYNRNRYGVKIYPNFERKFIG